MKNWPQFILGLTVLVVGLSVLPVGGPLPVGLLVAMLGILLLVKWSSETYHWECSTCGTTFRISMVQDLTGINGGIRKKYVRCPACGCRRWCRGHAR